MSGVDNFFVHDFLGLGSDLTRDIFKTTESLRSSRMTLARWARSFTDSVIRSVDSSLSWLVICTFSMLARLLPEKNFTELILRVRTWWLIVAVFGCVALHELGHCLGQVRAGAREQAKRIEREQQAGAVDACDFLPGLAGRSGVSLLGWKILSRPVPPGYHLTSTRYLKEETTQ